MPPVETINVDTPNAGCDGGGGTQGHPRVALTLTRTGRASCPYCGREYVLRTGVKTGSHGH